MRVIKLFEGLPSVLRAQFKGCQKARKNEVDKWCLKNIIVDGVSLGLEDIIVAQYPSLLKIVEVIDDMVSKGIVFPYENIWSIRYMKSI